MKINHVWKLSRLGVLSILIGLGLGQINAAWAEAAPAQKQEIPVVPDSTERKILEHIQETNLIRLKGWPGMIFYCPTDEAKTPALKQICTESNANLEALAAQYGVKFHKARNANDVAVLPHLTGRLKLVIELNSTEPETQTAAIAARVSVLAHYAQAISRSSELTAAAGSSADTGQAKHPLMVPQHVDAILWEASVINASDGGQEALVRPIVEGIQEKLKAFFADYARANQ